MKTPKKQTVTPTIFLKITGKDNVTSIALKNASLSKAKEVGNKIYALYQELGLSAERTRIENEKGQEI